MSRSLLHAIALPLAAALMLSGCADGEDRTDDAAAGVSAAPTGTAAEAEELLVGFGLDGMDTIDLIDHLDRLGGADRPQDLMASVRPDRLVLSADDSEVSVAIPGDVFYMSVAPYIEQTHECFNHSLTTCTGELASTPVDVRIVDETNDEVVVDETVTTFENGFVGFWLPRDIEGTLSVTYEGRSGEVDIATGPEDPTCITTLQLT